MDIHENHRKNEEISHALDLYNLHQEKLHKTENGIYNYIQSILPNEAVTYIIIIIIVMIIIIIISPTPIQIFAFGCGIVVVYFLISKRDTTKNEYNINEEMKLLSEQLRSTQFFYMDTDLIDLFYDLGDYQFYSNTKFKEIINHIDNFLHLQTDMENNVQDKKYVYDIMIDLKSQILNDFHAMIYDLPQQSNILDRFKCALKKLHLLLNQHLDEVRKIIKRLDGKLPIDMYPPNYPVADDPTINPHYDLY